MTAAKTDHLTIVRIQSSQEIRVGHPAKLLEQVKRDDGEYGVLGGVRVVIGVLCLHLEPNLKATQVHVDTYHGTFR